MHLEALPLELLLQVLPRLFPQLPLSSQPLLDLSGSSDRVRLEI